jgi:hypothetical protein
MRVTTKFNRIRLAATCGPEHIFVPFTSGGKIAIEQASG